MLIAASNLNFPKKISNFIMNEGFRNQNVVRIAGINAKDNVRIAAIHTAKTSLIDSASPSACHRSMPSYPPGSRIRWQRLRAKPRNTLLHSIKGLTSTLWQRPKRCFRVPGALLLVALVHRRRERDEEQSVDVADVRRVEIGGETESVEVICQPGGLEAMRRSRKRRRERKRPVPSQASMRSGDSVIVKSGILDPNLDVDIGGWQGRVVEVEEDMVSIEWDSVTLNQMPGSVIERCEEQGLNWQLMRLHTREVQVTAPRDALQDVAKAQRELEDQSTWLALGE